ncbi:unnamed protein product [Sphagnum jensenii]|uniref:Uncharacterized protein n=1 Tax=Sphagnum jensenii TaxID=128206 RepID=A0ABP0V860_9BRYO
MPRTSFYTPLRWLFGDVLLPNSLWPTWMLEGLAVYDETKYTTAGRGRSPYYDMIFRTAAEAGVLDTSKFITLDMLNSSYPWYPYGENVYAFGYSMMNQVARTNVGTETSDGKDTIAVGPAGHEGDNLLGEMSIRSSARIPFFINGNVENLSGKDWYTHWANWVDDTNARAKADIKTIRSQPVTEVRLITHGGEGTLGTAFSADGKWMAYSQDSADEPFSLYLMNRKTGKTDRLYEKVEGANEAFTPDSKFLVYSTLNRKDDYDLWSDLKYYSIDQDKEETLSSRLRARDPDISPDGKWITYTVSHDATTGLAIAPLTYTTVKKVTKLSMGKNKEIFWPTKLDAVHSPKFSNDGKRIYFAWHVNGKISEEIAYYDRDTNKVSVVVNNGKLNYYPTLRPGSSKSAKTDDVIYVCDSTGVDNLCEYLGGTSRLVTNTTGGFAFPEFDQEGKLFADTFSYKGWDIAEIHGFTPVKPEAVTISSPPAPVPDADQINHSPDGEMKKYPVDNYSIWPSILPRQWAPAVLYSPGELYAGGEILGFDAVDIHSYVIAGAYDTLVKQADYLVSYTNRQLGPSFTFQIDEYTSNVISNGSGSSQTLLAYDRNLNYSIVGEFPIQYTYSTLTPYMALTGNRNFLYVPGTNPGNTAVAASFFVPYLDSMLFYSEAHTSRLAITSEEGRSAAIGERTYFNSGQTFEKLLVADQEYWRTDFLLKHSVLVPTINYSRVNQLVTSGYLDTDVTVEGRQAGRLLNSLPGQSLTSLVMRGYPLQTFYSRDAGVGSLDYRFPILPIFRGLGTDPLYFNQLHGFVFGEDTYFPSGRRVKSLPSAGGGLQLDMNAFNSIPFTASTEYHKGFRQDFGGKGEVFFQLLVNSPLSL